MCVAFCACEPEAVTLVRHHMWPATPKNPTLAFHQDLFLWLESLILEGCMGVDAFCRALDCKRGKSISSQVSKTSLTSAILNYVLKFVSCFFIFHNFIKHIFALFSSETYILLLLRLLRNLGAYLSV